MNKNEEESRLQRCNDLNRGGGLWEMGIDFTGWTLMEKGRFEKNVEIHLNGVKKDGGC